LKIPPCGDVYTVYLLKTGEANLFLRSFFDFNFCICTHKTANQNNVSIIQSEQCIHYPIRTMYPIYKMLWLETQFYGILSLSRFSIFIYKILEYVINNLWFFCIRYSLKLSTNFYQIVWIIFTILISNTDQMMLFNGCWVSNHNILYAYMCGNTFIVFKNKS
jgi:hypothetical protein